MNKKICDFDQIKTIISDILYLFTYPAKLPLQLHNFNLTGWKIVTNKQSSSELRVYWTR